MTRQTFRYVLLLALAVILFYWKTLLTNQFTLIVGAEGVDQSYAWLHFWLHSIRHWQPPLWDRYAFAGSPFAGETLTTAFYPLRLIFALAPLHNGMVSPRLFNEYLAFTHLLCAWFMFALLRELGRSRFASFIGACAFALGGLLARITWPQYIESAIWLPALFFFLLRALRAQRRERALLEGAFCGLCLGVSILTGGMAFFIMQAIVVVTAIAFHGLTAASDSGRLPRWIDAALILGIVVAVAAGFGAIQLLPSAEYSHLSIRYIDGGPIAADQKIPYHRLVPGDYPQSIVSGIFPNGFDGKLAGEEYIAFYIGVLPFFLAVVGIWKYWSEVWVRYMAGLAVMAFAYTLGAFSPLYGVLYAVTPWLWLTRSPDRFVYLVSFALAVLAAYGLDALLDPVNRASWTPARSILKWIAIAAGAALFVPAIFSQPALPVWTALSLLLILGACAWIAYLFRNTAPAAARVLLAAFVLFDLCAFSWTEGPTLTGNAADALNQMKSLRGPAEFIKAQPGLHRVRVLGAGEEPNIGDVYQIDSVFGGGPALLSEYSDFGGRDNLLNVRYLIRPASAPDPGPVYFDGIWKVYEASGAYPRAWVVHEVVTAHSHREAFGELDRPGIDLHRAAVTEMPLAQPIEPANAPDSVSFRSYTTNRMMLDVDAAGTGLLVLSEMYYPGWIATVNGRNSKIYPVDGALRGIAVGAGRNHIEVVYRPSSVRAGAVISIMTILCVLAGWLFVGRHRPHLHHFHNHPRSA